MPALLTVIGLVVVFFTLLGTVLARSNNPRWMRVSLVLPCCIMVIAGCWVILDLLYEHYRLPPSRVVLAQMQESAAHADRDAVILALRSHGFKPVVHEFPFRDESDLYHLDPFLKSLSVSYLTLRTTRLSRSDLFAEYIDAVFLFNERSQLIAWSYITFSPGL